MGIQMANCRVKLGDKFRQNLNNLSSLKGSEIRHLMQVKLFLNITSIAFDYLLISWVTN